MGKPSETTHWCCHHQRRDSGPSPLPTEPTAPREGGGGCYQLCADGIADRCCSTTQVLLSSLVLNLTAVSRAHKRPPPSVPFLRPFHWRAHLPVHGTLAQPICAGINWLHLAAVLEDCGGDTWGSVSFFKTRKTTCIYFFFLHTRLRTQGHLCYSAVQLTKYIYSM